MATELLTLSPFEVRFPDEHWREPHMLENRITLQLHREGQTGNFDLELQEWDGSTIEIKFTDCLHTNDGTIRFDGTTSRAIITSRTPYTGSLADPEAYAQYFGSILSTFSNAMTFGWSPEPARMVTYDESYHEDNNYTHGDPKEIEIKRVQAALIKEMAQPGKCVIAGCSNGELVRQCRDQGIDAHGFDVIPNLADIAFPEVRDYLRVGSLTHIPFDESDGFDTLIAIDVLEHIPERDIPAMVEEWTRMGFQKLVLLINLNQFWYPGHITLRPISWWGEQWKTRFRLSQTLRKAEHLPQVYSNSGHYNQQWTLWERVLM